MLRGCVHTLIFIFTLASVPLVICAADVAPPNWNAIAEESARLLSEYIRIDTQNPPGRTVEAADFLEPLLRNAGLTVERIAADAEKPILLGRLRGSGGLPKPIILLNHTDVVPVDPPRWSFAPLSGDIRDGLVHGRGAIDMKGFAIIQLMALRLLAEQAQRPQHDVLFLATPDEEIGGQNGMVWLTQHRPDIMDAAAVWSEGGLGLTDAFPAPALFISVTEKQVLWLRLIAEGPSGHGSRPIPNAAPQRLQQALERIFANLPPPRLTSISRQVFRRIGSAVGGMDGYAMRHLRNPIVWLFADGILNQDPLTAAMVRDTIALTMLHAGYKPNVIPERAEAVLDCRLLPGTDQDAFLRNLQKTIADPAVRIEIIQPTQPAPSSPTDHPLYRAIEGAARRTYPDTVLSPSMTLGGTDLRFFRARGVPAYGFIPMLLSKELIHTVHGTDERLPVSSLGPAVRVLYEALREM